MEQQFKYLHDLSLQYIEYNNNSNSFYKALNSLPKEHLQKIYVDYGDPERSFQPVNILRAEVLRQMLDGQVLDNNLVENIKQKIRDKDLSFFSFYSPKILNELSNYPSGKRDMFTSWQRPWNVFHTFIYSGTIKQTVNQYLVQICQQLIKDLELDSYDYHYVDFYGPANFGTDYCWIALYPLEKDSHQEAYQFFLKIAKPIIAGRVAGGKLKKSEPNSLKEIISYKETKDIFENFKSDILRKNQSLRSYFKFAPGAQASEWQRFKNEEIIAINYHELELEDLSGINSIEEINEKAGLEPNSKKLENVLFFLKAKIGDIVFITKGVNMCLGIGIINGQYYFEKNVSNYPHRRKVIWLTDKVYEYNSSTLEGYKNLFVGNTFSPVRPWDFILKEYLRLYPELSDKFKEYGLIESKINSTTISTILEQQINEIIEEEIPKEQSYWWLNANPAVWSISSASVGETQTYTSRNERGNKRRIYTYFEQVKPGDILIGYESSPVKQISGIFEITKSLYQSQTEGEVIEFKLIEKLEVPVHWNELIGFQGLEKCDVFINNQGSLFKITDDEFDIIRDIIDTKNIQLEKQINEVIPPYSYASDPEKPFIPKEEIETIIKLLERKKNLILQGSPGVGKTFVARKIAYEMMGQVNDLQIEMIQFHQSYSYEDFIQGLRPSANKTFEVKPGIFFSFCKKAQLHPDKKYFFIIDEINRGNLSKIFGELMMLIEADKRHERFKVHLTYSEDEEKFYIPSNLYIIGTMNTADRSLSIVDYALRRRFAFYEVQPSFETQFEQHLRSSGISKDLVKHIKEKIYLVNQQICQDSNLGSGFQIGHSYFCSFKNGFEEKSWYEDILRYEIKPLLQEIWFDEHDKVEQILEKLYLV